jgi:phosphate transport system substrate-binding protein
MDFTTTLITFGAILSLVALIGAAFSFLLAHDQNAPSFKRTRRVIASVTLILLIAILGLQYLAAPATSIFTLIPAVPYPHSSLLACHVSASDLPAVAVAGHASPLPIRANVRGRTLSIRGSTALSNLFARAGAAFDAAYHTTTHVAATTSQDGLMAVEHGETDIGLSDIFVQDAPDPNVSSYVLTDYPVGVVVFTLMVSPDLKGAVQNITTDQLIDIYSGKVTNWRSLGGPDEPITPIGREIGSGTQVSFQKYVLLSTPKDTNIEIAGTTNFMLNLLAKKRGAIGYAASTVFTGNRSAGAQPICLNGYGATLANVNAGTYPYWNYEHAYVKHMPANTATDVAGLFLRYVCSASFQQKDVRGFGFLRIADLQPAAVAAHPGYPKPQPCGGTSSSV